MTQRIVMYDADGRAHHFGGWFVGPLYPLAAEVLTQQQAQLYYQQLAYVNQQQQQQQHRQYNAVTAQQLNRRGYAQLLNARPRYTPQPMPQMIAQQQARLQRGYDEVATVPRRVWDEMVRQAQARAPWTDDELELA